MPYTEPTSLAIVACPGGEAFANEVITHLKHMYKHRFTLKNDVISKRYNMDIQKLIEDINFRNDMVTSDLVVRGAIDKYRAPDFKINTAFTWFANGEVKAELMDSVRGKDIYIFQDAENHLPIEMNGGKNVGSISAKTSYVLAGENMGPAKLEKAQKLGIKIISEDEFLTMIGKE